MPDTAVTLTHGLADAAPAAVALDIVYGARAATNCSVCGRHMPAADKPVFELETADGKPLCLVHSDKQHHGLRLVCAVMGHVVEAYGTGDKQAAEETIRGFQSAIELLAETAPKVPYTRPVRKQPVRHGRRGRRR